jgi:two-component system sensor histidine kinase PilS (NtrC family)
MFTRQALSAESRATFWRSLQTLNATRVVIALVLLVYLSFRQQGACASPVTIFMPEICIVYLGLSIAVRAARPLIWQRRFLLQLMFQIACDLAVISLLYLAGGGVRSGLAILYLFPLAGRGDPGAAAAGAVLRFAGDAVPAGREHLAGVHAGRRSRLLQSGLYGAAFFAAVLVVNRWPPS